MKISIFCLGLIFPMLLSAQGTVFIRGAIENGSADSISLVIDQNYLSRRFKTYKIPVRSGEFSQEIALSRNTFADFTYRGQTIKLYLEPGEHLGLQFKTGNLQETIVFSDKGASANKFLRKFEASFAPDYDASAMGEKIKTLAVDEFEMNIYDNRKKERAFYENDPDKASFSEDFKNYMDNRISYNYLRFLFAWPIVNASKSNTILTVNPLPAVMLDALDKKKLSDSRI
jgi:hypothetical protein